MLVPFTVDDQIFSNYLAKQGLERILQSANQ